MKKYINVNLLGILSVVIIGGASGCCTSKLQQAGAPSEVVSPPKVEEVSVVLQEPERVSVLLEAPVVVTSPVIAPPAPMVVVSPPIPLTEVPKSPSAIIQVSGPGVAILPRRPVYTVPTCEVQCVQVLFWCRKCRRYH